MAKRATRAARPPDPILMLSGQPRPDAMVIAIDGVRYRLRDADELSIPERARLQRAGRAFERLAAEAVTDPRELADLQQLIRQATGHVVVDLPPTVLEALGDGHCAAILERFIGRGRALGLITE